MNPRARALLETVLVMVVLTGTHKALRALGASVATGTLGTFLTLLLCTVLLRRESRDWRAVGFTGPAGAQATTAWALGLFVVEMAANPLISAPLANALGFAPQHLEAFADLKGNTVRYLVMLLPVAWGAAAFGEEMIFRGFINLRLTTALGGGKAAAALALVTQAALFGAGHLYLGARGALAAGVLGLVAGAAFLANGRRLWPLVIAHGLVDSFAVTALYLGVAHG